LWVLGNHRLLCGDGTKRDDLERVLDRSSSDMIFTDLPYNADYSGKTSQRLKIVNDNLGDGFSHFLAAACQACLRLELKGFDFRIFDLWCIKTTAGQSCLNWGSNSWQRIKITSSGSAFESLSSSSSRESSAPCSNSGIVDFSFATHSSISARPFEDSSVMA
jgi:DNA modification methylase